MSQINPPKHNLREEVPVADDPRRDPIGGIYSGMTKRLAISDGAFAEVADMPTNATKPNSRKAD